jgi:hypothetical protein
MTLTMIADITLETQDCASCGVRFAAPQSLLRERRETGKDFFCPNGHSLVFRKSEAQALREKVERLEGRARHLEDQRAAAERSNIALRGSNTKLRKRIANGVCPCCRRSFKDLARHMSGQHPDYAA